MILSTEGLGHPQLHRPYTKRHAAARMSHQLVRAAALFVSVQGAASCQSPPVVFIFLSSAVVAAFRVAAFRVAAFRVAAFRVAAFRVAASPPAASPPAASPPAASTPAASTPASPRCRLPRSRRLRRCARAFGRAGRFLGTIISEVTEAPRWPRHFFCFRSKRPTGRK